MKVYQNDVILKFSGARIEEIGQNLNKKYPHFYYIIKNLLYRFYWILPSPRLGIPCQSTSSLF